MVKYRLTWRGTGALDLSQVLDECGMPVLFTRPGECVLVSAGTYRHPTIQGYVGHGLQADEIGTTPVAVAPPSPTLPPALPSLLSIPVPSSPLPSPPPPVLEPVVETSTPTPSPPPEVIPDTVSVPVVEEARPVEAINMPDKGRRSPRGRSR